MSGMLKQLRQAATKLGIDGDPLDEARARVLTLRVSMEGMKSTLLGYSRHLLTHSQSAAQVAQEWAGLYSHSPARSNSLQTFTSNQARIEAIGFRLYKDNYGWDVLKVFDDWESDATKMLQDIDKTDKARQQVAAHDDKVRSLRASKDRRLKNNQPLTPKEESQLDASEQMLEKYSVMLSNMRVNLDKNLNNFFEQRFATLDKAFVRFMEIQIEFTKESAAASANYQTIVDNYRKRFPRQTGTQYGAAPEAQSPLPAVDQGSADQPARARSTPPQQETPPQRPPQQQQQQVTPVAKKTSPPPPQRNQNDDSSDYTDSSDSGSETDSSDDEDESPKPTPKKHHHHATHAAEPIDLFNFPATAAPPAASKPAPKPATQGDDLIDFFGGATVAPSAKPAAAKKPAPASSDFDFDFSGGGSSASSTTLAAPPSKHLPTSSSTPSFATGNGNKKDDLLSFDPFAISSPPPKAQQSSAPQKARSASPPPAPPGTSTSGLVNAYIPPTHKLEEHIANQQEAKVAALREADDAAEQALEARKEAEGGLESMLVSWETNKDGNKKNIRNLLSSVHTVLWPNSGWKPVSFADLIDFNAIKKAHMKVIRVVHPDKLTDATPEQMVIALRVFDTLNSAFDRFKETGQ